MAAFQPSSISGTSGGGRRNEGVAASQREAAAHPGVTPSGVQQRGHSRGHRRRYLADHCQLAKARRGIAAPGPAVKKPYQVTAGGSPTDQRGRGATTSEGRAHPKTQHSATVVLVGRGRALAPRDLRHRHGVYLQSTLGYQHNISRATSRESRARKATGLTASANEVQDSGAAMFAATTSGATAHARRAGRPSPFST